MDSSSDNEEFYECDDDLDEDLDEHLEKEEEIIKDVCLKKDIPAVKEDNNDTKQELTTKNEAIENNNQDLINNKVSNNNPQEQVEVQKENPVVTIDDKVVDKDNDNNKQLKSLEVEDITKNVEETSATNKNNNVSLNHLSEEVNKHNLSKGSEDDTKVIEVSLEKDLKLKEDEGKTSEVTTLTKSLETKEIKVETLETQVKKENVVGSEDLWEDDWGNMDQTDTITETKESKALTEIKDNLEVKNDRAKKSDEKLSKHETKVLETKQTEVFEENLWEDEDDWGKLESEPVDIKVDNTIKVTKENISEPEEDLWGEGDGWGVSSDTPQATPKKESAEVSNSLQTDLWGEGDNWNIDEASEITNKTTDHGAKSALDALTNKEESSWGGWSNWGISSVLSTAATITTSVSQGISTVLESGIGVPDPAELARIHKEEAEKRRNAGEDIPEGDESSENFNPFGLSNFVPGNLHKIGSSVINKGLGTLETIGKKTYEVLQENDPQLKKKRALLKMLEADKPVLSAMLREAKERAESENIDREKRHFAKKANYETMFDDYTGLVHLEALEMLSKQCDFKLESILSQSRDVVEVQETMEQIKDLCELNTDEDDDEERDFDELKSQMTNAIEEINIGISCEKVLETWVEVAEWVDSTSSTNPDEIHSNAIENLAKITAMAVEQYHKAAELLLVKEHRSTADEADSLVQLTTSITSLIGLLSSKYTEKLKNLSTQSSTNDIKTLISNIYLEAANSSRYVEDAFSLLIPVIQVGAV